MGQRARVVIGILVSAFFLFWALKLVGDVGAVARILERAQYVFILPALVAYFFGVWLRSWRWHFLLRPVRPIPARKLFPVVVIGYMANDVLPARLGELFRAYVLGEQEGVPKTTTLATIVVERMFDGVAMLVFVAMVAAFVPLSGQIAQVARLASVIFLTALIVLFLAGSSRRRAIALVERVELTLPSSLQGKVGRLAERFLEGLDSLRSPGLAAAILGLSLGAWLCEATMYALLALGFRLGLSYWAFMLTTAVANLFAMVPAAPGYVGTFDVGALASLALFGADHARAAGYVLVLHAILLIPVTLLGFFYLWRANLSLSLRDPADGRATTKREVSP